MTHRRIRSTHNKHERSVILHRAAIAITCMAVARTIRSLTPRMLLRAFCTPFVKVRPTAAQQALLDAGERFTVTVPGGQAAGWRWGRGPAVLLVHGWAGRASQMTAWVPTLTRRGYSVIAIDQPAHGESPGSSTNAVIMKNILLKITARTGPLAAVVAHSLGGLVSSYAMSRGMKAGSTVLISSPSAPGPFFEQLMKMARIPTARRAEVMSGAEELLGETFDRFSTRSSWRGGDTPALLIHDRSDRQVPFSTVAQNLESIPHAEVLETKGLGHTRILDDAVVLDSSVALVAAHTDPSIHLPLAPGFAADVTSTRVSDQPLVSIDEVMADLAYGQC